MPRQKTLPKTQAPAAKRRERRGDTRPQEIVDAAFEEFAAKGYAGTRLEDVAARARVSKGLPYLYFKTKEALFRAVIKSVITAHFDVMRQSMETTTLSSEAFLKGPFLSFLQELVCSKRAFIARLLIAGLAQTMSEILRCLRWNHGVPVIRSDGVARPSRPAWRSRNAAISAAAAGSSEASLPKCLSRPLMTARHERAGSSGGGYAR